MNSLGTRDLRKALGQLESTKADAGGQNKSSTPANSVFRHAYNPPTAPQRPPKARAPCRGLRPPPLPLCPACRHRSRGAAPAGGRCTRWTSRTRGCPTCRSRGFRRPAGLNALLLVSLPRPAYHALHNAFCAGGPSASCRRRPTECRAAAQRFAGPGGAGVRKKTACNAEQSSLEPKWSLWAFAGVLQHYVFLSHHSACPACPLLSLLLFPPRAYLRQYVQLLALLALVHPRLLAVTLSLQLAVPLPGTREGLGRGGGRARTRSLTSGWHRWGGH